jgi:hypothetical protein
MANKPTDLASALNRNASGQTVQVSPLDKKPKDLKQLLDEKGLPVAPLTPGAAGALGANPDQQKMVGTPAQKKSALEPQDLATTLRTAQARTQATGQEQGMIAKENQLSSLSNLSDRVRGLVGNEINKLTPVVAGAGSIQSTIPTAGLSVPKGSEANVKALAAKVMKDPKDFESMKALNLALGRTNSNPLKLEEIPSLYETATDTIIRTADSTLDKNITVSDLITRGNLGYDANQLSGLLNIPADQLNNYTIEQLRERVNQVSEEESQATNQDTENITSNLASQAERDQAVTASKDNMAVGTFASSADYDTLNKSIQNAENVTFNGKTYTVSELLKDGGINTVIKDYLGSAPDSPARKSLVANNPEFAAFLDRNDKVLKEAVTSLQSSTKEFGDIQTYNAGLAQAAESLSPELKEGMQFSANSTDFATGKATTTGNTLVDIVGATAPENRQALTSMLNEANKNYPGIIKQLTKLPRDQANKWDIANPNGPFQTKFLPAMKVRQALASTNDPTQIANIVSPGAGSWDEVQRKYKEMRTAAQLGLGPPPDMAWDTDGNGELDPPEMLRDNMLSKLSTNLSMDPANFQEAKPLNGISGNDVGGNGLAKKLFESGAAGSGKVDLSKIDLSTLSDEELSAANSAANNSSLSSYWNADGKTVTTTSPFGKKVSTTFSKNKDLLSKEMNRRAAKKAEERGRQEDSKLMEKLQKLPVTSGAVYIPGLSDPDL